MSLLFELRHIEQLREGEKTVTRRDWDKNYNRPNEGTIPDGGHREVHARVRM